jgi:hypothetical protein
MATAQKFLVNDFPWTAYAKKELLYDIEDIVENGITYPFLPRAAVGEKEIIGWRLVTVDHLKRMRGWYAQAETGRVLKIKDLDADELVHRKESLLKRKRIFY